MKNISHGVKLFLFLILSTISIFFCVNITIYSNSNNQMTFSTGNISTTNYIKPHGLGDAYSFSTWGAEKMGVPEYSQYLLDIIEADNGYNALEEIVIAVIDTGIDTNHSWFTNRFLYDEEGKILGLDYTSDETNVNSEKEYAFEDDQGHGTHCAGIICDMTLSNVKILPVKIMYKDTDGEGTGDMYNAISAIKDLIDLKQKKNINIVAFNMSFGGSVDKTKHSDQVLIEDFTNAIEDAYKAGIFSVVAAGNNGVDACNELPAMIDTAITVSATDYYLDLASFSNFGNCIDVCAPGVAIDSAYFSDEELVKTLHGTSMAAPHITAYIALLYSDPVIKYTLKDIQNILLNNYLNLNTVKDLGEEGKDSSFGCGLPILNNLMGQVAYKVNYYLEPIYDLQANTTPELNNYQLINSKTYYGVLGELTNFIPDNYNGFTQIEFDEQIIDENTIINIYFKRNIYKLVIQTSEIGIQSVTGEGEYLYGADVELFAELQEEYIWDVWEIKECTSNIFYNNFKQGVCEQKFKMPDSDLILSANAKNKSEQNLDWSNLFIWGSGFIVLVIFLMYISRPRIKNH